MPSLISVEYFLPFSKLEIHLICEISLYDKCCRVKNLLVIYKRSLKCKNLT